MVSEECKGVLGSLLFDMDIYFRVFLLLASTGNVLLIVVTWKKQNESWNQTRFFMIVVAILDMIFVVGTFLLTMLPWVACSPMGMLLFSSSLYLFITIQFLC
jgi:hypothetical protein